MNQTKEHKPGYKNTPLGWIPEEWEELSILTLARNKKENFDDGDWIEAEYLTSNGIRLIQTGNIGIGVFVDKESTKYISDESFHELRCKEIIPGDILICRLAAPAGRACILPDIGEGKIITSVDVSIFRPNEELVCKQYIISVFSLDRWFKIVNERCGGSTRSRIARGELGKILVPIPPIKEQQKIARTIETWNIAIQSTRQLIKQLKERNRGLTQQLLTCKKRLNGFNGKWQHVQVREIASEISIKNKTGKTLTVLSCTKYHGLVDSLEYFGRKIYSEDTSTYKVVPYAHFAYATNHIEEGSIGYQSLYKEALISPMYTVFKTTEQVDDNYLYKVLKSQHYIHEYRKRMEGSIDRRGGLRWDEFSKIPIQLPPTEEQKAIASVLDKATEELKLYEQQLANRQQQKNGLMQKLLSGEVRVRT